MKTVFSQLPPSQPDALAMKHWLPEWLPVVVPGPRHICPRPAPGLRGKIGPTMRPISMAALIESWLSTNCLGTGCCSHHPLHCIDPRSFVDVHRRSVQEDRARCPRTRRAGPRVCERVAYRPRFRRAANVARFTFRAATTTGFAHSGVVRRSSFRLGGATIIRSFMRITRRASGRPSAVSSELSKRCTSAPTSRRPMRLRRLRA